MEDLDPESYAQVCGEFKEKEPRTTRTEQLEAISQQMLSNFFKHSLPEDAAQKSVEIWEAKYDSTDVEEDNDTQSEGDEEEEGEYGESEYEDEEEEEEEGAEGEVDPTAMIKAERERKSAKEIEMEAGYSDIEKKIIK